MSKRDDSPPTLRCAIYTRKSTEDVRRALGDIHYPFDILFITTQWFEQSKEVIGGIAYPAHKYGKVIYDPAA